MRATTLAAVTVPDTGGWAAYQSVHVPVTFAAGDQVGRPHCEKGDFNIDLPAVVVAQRAARRHSSIARRVTTGTVPCGHRGMPMASKRCMSEGLPRCTTRSSPTRRSKSAVPPVRASISRRSARSATAES